MFPSLKINLVHDVVMPLVDLSRKLAATLPGSHDLQLYTELYAPDFPHVASIQISSQECPAVLRACAQLRLELRRTLLTHIPDDVLENGPDAEAFPGEEKVAVLCYLFLSTLQLAILDKASPHEPLVASIGRSIRAAWGRLPWASREQAAATNCYRVVVRNDPVNLMAYVTAAFRIVIGMTKEQAEQHMREVHEQKHSTVWRGGRLEAERLANSLRGWHLQAAAEPEAGRRGHGLAFDRP